jgi:exosome complex component RRP45
MSCRGRESLVCSLNSNLRNIRVDIAVLDDQGNVTDCACIAAISSLLHFRIPQVTVDGDGVVVHDEMEKSPVPLSIHHIPIATSFSIVGRDGSDFLMLDPTGEEEAAGIEKFN